MDEWRGFTNKVLYCTQFTARLDDVEAARVAALIADGLLGDDPPGARTRMLADALRSGEPITGGRLAAARRAGGPRLPHGPADPARGVSFHAAAGYRTGAGTAHTAATASVSASVSVSQQIGRTSAIRPSVTLPPRPRPCR
ncbi:hypothetical protein OIE71_01095 [Streptomyces sp. NBC_01725]|uniref:hypothetical protein n=1 Tax=Streptomyces sp. NBC_01725 TaxID=2975923 RepID=UPI002E2AF719|nr:hypothetical protein [Streptomyces sp. NBC_01725]